MPAPKPKQRPIKAASQEVSAHREVPPKVANNTATLARAIFDAEMKVAMPEFMDAGSRLFDAALKRANQPVLGIK